MSDVSANTSPSLRPATPPPATPFRVFISYARKDLSYLKDLQEHLSELVNQGWILPWTDQDMLAGDEWSPVLEAALNNAQVVLLLVSASFNASKFIQTQELTTTCQHYREGKTVVIPILIRDVYLLNESRVSEFQYLPHNGTAIKSWTNKDAAWTDVVRGIHDKLKGLVAAQAIDAPEDLASPLPIEPPTSVQEAPELLRVMSAIQVLPPDRRFWQHPWLFASSFALLVLAAAAAYLGVTDRKPCPEPEEVLSAWQLNPVLELPPELPLQLVAPDSSLANGPFREQVAELLRHAARRGFGLVVLDMAFAPQNGLEGEQALREALTAAHQRTPPMRVAALRPSEPGSTPLMSVCSPGGGTDCFDALLSGRFLEDSSGLRLPWPAVNVCPDGEPWLAKVISDVVASTKVGSPGAESAPGEALKVSLQRGCTSFWLRLRPSNGSPDSVYQELDSATFLAESGQAPASSPILIVAELNNESDFHNVLVGEAPHESQRMAGAKLALHAVRHLLAAQDLPSGVDQAWQPLQLCVQGE